ncbi:MAG: amidinotransferase [Deltaproteobacteria bacterium]|nr:amidinotransferase [Deltaproteobacteria bacterium]
MESSLSKSDFLTNEAHAQNQHCPVNTHNEWDPLKEVIVGRLEYATIPNNHVLFTQSLPSTAAKLYRPIAGRLYPKLIVEPAQQELNEFIHILEAEGITVRRPDVLDFSKPFRSPHWKAKGFCTASPRDGLLVIGDTILETPMAWRSRYFEIQTYHTLLTEYWKKGAKWISAPKPRLLDSLYERDYTPPAKDEPMRYIINESEIVFDAADFVRCGRDLFVTKSNVTNYTGIEWLRRFLGDGFRIHEVETRCRQPMHIDTTFIPLAPGKVLVNPDFVDVDRLPPVLKSWDILVAPEPDPYPAGWRFYLSMVSKWISLNVLMLDQKRVVVEKSQVSMIKKFKDWGFEPIPCPFMNYKMFGGGFHCATLDIKREGTLESYF